MAAESDRDELSALVGELRALYAELHSSKGTAAWLGRFFKGLESDPRVQIKVHKWAAVFWAVNMLGAVLVYFMLPGIWSKLAVFYILIVSLYSNLATDYDGLSSAQAHLHSLEASEAAIHTQEK